MAVEEDTIFVGDTGTILEVELLDADDVVVPIGTATSLTIKLSKPDGITTLTKTAVLTTDGLDGKLEYVTISGDIDQAGPWQIQGFVTLPTWSGPSAIGHFEVAEPL